MKNKLWFKRKTYGYGWTPVTWKGWLFTVVWIIALYFTLARIDYGWLKNLLILIIMIGILFFVCYKKGEKPRWQWGKENKIEK